MREWSVGPPDGPGGVWDVLSEVQEALAEVPEVLERPPEGLGRVGRLCRWSGSSLELLPEVRESL